MRTKLLFLAPIALSMLAACGPSAARDDSRAAEGARGDRAADVRLAVRERIPAFLTPNGDSLLLAAASAAAISGRRVAVVLSYDDRLAVYDLDGDSALLIGGRGSGPGELTGGMWQVALSPAGYVAAASIIDGRVHLWAPGGALRFSRSVAPQLDPYPTVAADDSGRVYVAVESHASGKRRVQLIRLGRDSEDSVGSPWMDGPQPIVRIGKRGNVRRSLPDFAYVYGANPGKLWWAASPTGLVYLANADRYRIDTMRLGRGRGVLIDRPDVRAEDASAAERERIFGGYATGPRGEAPITAADFGRVRRAVVHGLIVAGDELWVSRGRAADTGIAVRYDLYDARDGRVRRSIIAPRGLIGVGDNAALSSSSSEDGERSLVLLRPDSSGGPAHDSADWRVLTPRAVVASPRARASEAVAGAAGTSNAAASAWADTSGDFPGLGCAVLPARAHPESTIVRVRVEAGPPNRRRRVLARVSDPVAGAETGGAALTLVGGDAATRCSGRRVEFVLKGTLRYDLRVTVASRSSVVLTLYDANDARRTVTRVIRPGDGEVIVDLPPR